MAEVTLQVRTGNQTFVVPLGHSLTIGRSESASISVDDEGLSYIHASVHRDGDSVWILDERSATGSFVNGQPVPPSGTWLRDGDQIAVGRNTTLTVRIHANAPRPPAPTAPRSLPQTGSPTALPRTTPTAWTPPQIAALSAALIISFVAIIVIIAQLIKRSGSTDGASTPRPPIISTRSIDRFKVNAEALVDAFDVPEPPPKIEEISDADWRQALVKTSEDRKEPVGLDAPLTEIPAELRQYAERGRFLAIQTAKAVEQRLVIPHDYAELARMRAENQFVDVKPVGDGYVVYAVGGIANEKPFTHFDRASQRSVPLYRSKTELQAGLTDGAPDAAFISSFYNSPSGFSIATAEFAAFNQLAGNFGGKTYDLGNGAARREFRKRLLTMIRPPALALLEELGRSYKRQFNRLLPVSSLVRTEEYQRELSQVNTAAARNAVPPHTTGLAIDISYGFMTAAEQKFVMDEIARLERAGRVEALRENNNCFHIFVFPDGRPPADEYVRRIMGAAPAPNPSAAK
jgi:hypothetical protein